MKSTKKKLNLKEVTIAGLSKYALSGVRGGVHQDDGGSGGGGGGRDYDIKEPPTYKGPIKFKTATAVIGVKG